MEMNECVKQTNCVIIYVDRADDGISLVVSVSGINIFNEFL